jgi:hypothetical protein
MARMRHSGDRPNYEIDIAARMLMRIPKRPA